MKTFLQSKQDKILVSGWSVHPSELIDPQKCARAREMGLDIAYVHPPKDSDSLLELLDVCEQNNVGVFYFDPSVYGITEDHYWMIPQKTASYARHPALYGIVLRDEPGVYDFPRLARLTRVCKEMETNAIPVINLYPDYANRDQLNGVTYEEYIDRFAREVDLPYLSYDYYPLSDDGVKHRVTDSYLTNFETVARACRKYRKDLWFFIQAMGFNQIMRIPTEEELRWQVYVAVSFGTKVLQLFCYATPDDAGGEVFLSALIDRNSQKTERYDLMKKIIAEMHGFDHAYLQYQHMGNMIFGSKAVSAKAEKLTLRSPDATNPITFTGNYAHLNHPLEQWFGIDAVETDQPILTGCFEHRENSNAHAVTLVNLTDPKDNQTANLTLSFSQSFHLKVYIEGKVQIKPHMRKLSLSLKPGEGVFIEY